MPGRGSVRRGDAGRRPAPLIERLERRELMTVGGLKSSLGAYVVPSQAGPAVTQPSKVVDAHASVEDLLSTILGPGLSQVEAASKTLGISPQAVLKQAVLNQSYVHSILANSSVYSLFGSPALTTLIGSEQVSGMTSAQAPSAATAATLASGITSAASAAATTATTTSNPLIAFSIPGQATIESTGDSTSVVQVNPLDGVAGFVVSVPNTDVRISSPGPPLTGSVLIPQSSLPANFPVPSTSVSSIGTFSSAYVATAPLLDQILAAGVKVAAPNAPSSVPGLRLASFLLHHDPFPSQGAAKNFARTLALAVQRNVFALNSTQMASLSAGITQFAGEVQGLMTSGAFTPPVPPSGATLPSGSLSGTLEVSAGVLTELLDVSPSVDGLALPALGNFPGRLDVGYVFDRSGNYGLMLTLRGPLENANPVPTPVDIATGEISVETSNAPNINALNGQRVVEGVEVGSGDASSLGASTFASGITTFSASAGNGFGLEYGTGVAYSTVIPLGNVDALIPASPRTS